MTPYRRIHLVHKVRRLRRSGWPPLMMLVGLLSVAAWLFLVNSCGSDPSIWNEQVERSESGGTFSP